MKPLFVFWLLVGIGLSCAFADVAITEHEDRFRIEIDGQLFTEWRHLDWKAPYLYPVIGPDGENITRHFPMVEDVEGEQKDHKHHRSIRFSHRNVNGMSFWAPDSNQGGHEVEIRLGKVEKKESGKTGELIFWNHWMGDGKLVLKEKVRLAFHPLENRQVLMDYDVELHTVETPITFHDEKDGGLGIRVASSMVVQHRETKEGNGTIVNSNGEKNSEAWGKRAEWADYFGPGASGKTVGIAIFDHPSNLRFPTHWHARTYGLMTANRFGTGFFDAKKGAKRGDGDYTIAVGEKLPLRHRLYFHLGDPETAKVEEQYRLYASDS